MKRKRYLGVAAVVAAAALAVGLSWPAAATPTGPEQGNRYFVLLGGTCDGTASQYQHIDLRGGVALPVHYPAAGNPTCEAPPISYDESVAQGHRAARSVLERAYADDPAGEFAIVGFSQGAHVANLVLEDVADGRIGVPKSKVSGSLYGDPMHPETGIGAILPKGASAFGFTSPGPGRTDFGGVPVERYCIETDGVCHFNTIEAPGGYVIQHPCYPAKVMPETLANEIVHGNHWWPRVGPC